MNAPRALPVLTCLAWLLMTTEASAAVYRCVDASGAVTYSQTPCAGQESTTVRVGSSTSDGSADCDAAQQFALNVANQMRRGSTSADVINRYGGIDSLSNSALNIVNYVFGFQHAADVVPGRIGALARSKCRAKSFGDVRCEILPPAYTESIGGCDANADEPPRDDAPSAKPANETPARSPQPVLAQQSAAPATGPTERDDRDACLAAVEREIDSIQRAMRGGYTSVQGEQYRARLRDLRQRRSEC